MIVTNCFILLTSTSINISKNYSPQLNWYAKYVELEKGIVIDDLKKKAPMQYNVYKHIKKASPTLLKVSSLKNICSNPVSTCQALEKKRLIILLKKGKDIFLSIDLRFQNIIYEELKKSIEKFSAI